MRENEQFSTQCTDIDLTEKTIIVRKQASNRKRQVDRLIPISSRLFPIVERLVRDAGGEGLIFTQRDLGRSFATACTKAGIDELRWHDLRDTAITWMVKASGNASEVMKISGHRQWKTFLRYLNMSPEMAREFAAKMDAYRESFEVTQAPEHVN